MSKEKAEVVLTLGGALPQRSDIRSVVAEAAYCIAADRGADLARLCGRLPDHLIGDMDSVSAETLEWCAAAQVPRDDYETEKDYTDGEKAFALGVEYALRHGYPRVFVVGGCGGRLDHTLANLYLSKGALDKGVEVVFCNDDSFIYMIKGYSCQKVELIHGKTVSLLAFAGEARGITLEGFYYPLREASLTFAETLGISNELVSEEGTVTLRQGYLMVIQNR